MTSRGNQYYSTDDDWFRIDLVGMDYAGWLAATGEVNSTDVELEFPDPSRDVGSYHGTLGREATLEAFAAAAIQMSKHTWDEDYTADVVNAYLRAGF